MVGTFPTWFAVLLAFRPALLGMGMATPQSTPKKAEKGSYTSRLGDLQITVTAAGAVSPNLARQRQIAPRLGSHFVIVNLKFKNLALYSSCPVLEAMVRVDLGFNYNQYRRGDLKDPKTQGLEPTEESQGSYVFEVKDGTRPVALRLLRDTFYERSCMNDQHRRGIPFVIRPKDVTLSLRNLPEPAN
jgi:hypothetical protein